jgi:hypothetical protein
MLRLVVREEICLSWRLILFWKLACMFGFVVRKINFDRIDSIKLILTKIDSDRIEQHI